MRIAALYDIHGNLPALEATLADVAHEAVDHVVVGGDVFPGPMSGACLDRLLGLDPPPHFLMGNGEAALLAQLAGNEAAVPAQAREIIRWEAEQLGPEHHRNIARWPATVSLESESLGRILFCHATPRNNTEIFTRLTPAERLLPIFDGHADVVVCGHTHMQFDLAIGATRVVNAGSVGMPFGRAGAFWLLLDDDVELRHTGYDVTGAAHQISLTTQPNARDYAQRFILDPPTEQSMLDLYSRSSL